MRYPDFLILGAARSATTSLHYYLDQHPGITMSMTKEPNFFAFDHDREPPAPLIDPASTIVTKSVVAPDAYRRLFDGAGPDDVLGEASPLYLYVRETPTQIRRFVPEPRLVAIVRHPVERAYSHWMHIRRDRPEGMLEGFRAACEAEMATGGAYSPYAGGSHILRMGLYAEQLDRYVDAFGRDALLVLPYEQVTGAPQEALTAICRHVGVADHDFDTGVRYNRSGVAGGRVSALLTGAAHRVQPRVKAVLPARLAARIGRWRATHDRPDEAPEIPADLRAALVDWFRPSVAELRSRGFVDTAAWADFD